MTITGALTYGNKGFATREKNRAVGWLTGDARRVVLGPLDDGAGRGEAVVRRLAGAIALGVIEDGEQLPAEAQLAASLNVATVTLREALAELRDRGLLDTRRGRGGGSFVRADEPALNELARGRLRELGSTDLRELGDLRSAVAGAAARLAATRTSGRDVRGLQAMIDRFAAAPRPADRRRLEGRYYIAVAAASQSARLTLVEFELQAELGQVLWALAGTAGEVAEAVAAHTAVLQAVQNRDGQAARARTEAHIGTVTQRLIQLHMDLTRQPSAEARRATS
jgi:DNA-binding FadR family transcriptional regulator